MSAPNETSSTPATVDTLPTQLSSDSSIPRCNSPTPTTESSVVALPFVTPACDNWPSWESDSGWGKPIPLSEAQIAEAAARDLRRRYPGCDDKHPDHLGTVKYWVRRGYKGELTLDEGQETTRYDVHNALKYHYCLRKHFTANLAIIDQYGENKLAAALSASTLREATLTPIEKSRNEFAYHHIGITECLLKIDGGLMNFGLLEPGGFRQVRNFFAHVFPTPMGADSASLRWGVEGKTEEYRELLEQVEANIGLLDGQLVDTEVWRAPVKRMEEIPVPPVPPVPPLPPAAAPTPVPIPHEEEAKGDCKPTFHARFRDCFGLRSRLASWCYNSPTIRNVFWDIETWFLNFRLHYEQMDERERERGMREMEEGEAAEWEECQDDDDARKV